MKKYNNIAFTYGPKNRDPFTNELKTRYFVPSYQSQQGDKYNYVVVTCSPQWNGVWRYDANLTDTYHTWMNGRMKCLYVPIKDCEKLKNLEDIKNEETRQAVINQQEAWLNSEVKNRNYNYQRGKPSWML